MLLDSSAMIAIVLGEPDAERLERQLATAPSLAIGAATLLEATIVLSARLGEDARGRVSRFILEAGVEVLPVTSAHVDIGMDAWLRFGKGRHPAALNFGDCLAYASAVLADEPLICIGEDFARTDCPRA
ncbi:MAG: type II toxin-antitoxin system VapC family toxin [Gemmatimonadales bacterium]|nr:type II toxin-antitoxin system VapC family toxin [Gemmatimonadales bacterium]